MNRPPIKRFQDPVWGQVAVHDPLLLALIDSRAVQRLRQVRQLGVGHFTFLGAEHSRFAHSLGALHLMGVALDHLEAHEGLALAPGERQAAEAAALLHDVGHCAFSHTMEPVLGVRHETLTLRLVLEDPELRRILGARRKVVAAVLTGRGKAGHVPLLHDLISSQLDMDRLDYLARDAHHTGVNSGRVDVPRLIATLTVHQGRLAVRDKGRLALEEYFLARYFMYWKVYFHKTSRCFELLLRALLSRARELQALGGLPMGPVTPAFRALLEQGAGLPLAEFLDHDESDLVVAMKAWAKGPDPVLADLCRRFMQRGRLKVLHEAADADDVLSEAQVRRAREAVARRHPGAGDYLFLEDRFGSLPYDQEQPVWLVDRRGRREDLAHASELIRSLTSRHALARYYAPHEDAPRLAKLLGLTPPAQLKLKLK